MKWWLITLAFLLVGSYIIIQANGIDVDDSIDRKLFIGKFAGWMVDVGGNMRVLTGNVIAMDWLPESNQSDSLDGDSDSD